MIEKIAFSVPGINGSSIPVPVAAGMPSGSENLNIAIQWGLTLIFIAAGIVALLFIIWGGISWITSGGEKEKIQEARNKIAYSLIGLIIIFSSYLIVRTVGGLFGVDPFELGVSHVACQGNAADQCGGNPHLFAECHQGNWVCKHD
jgi:hypothetical protein